MRSVDPLLMKIQRYGWRDRLAAQFQEQYGRNLRWQIVVQMEKFGFLQYRINPQFLGTVSSRKLELYENSLSDLWVELLGSLVDKFLEGVKRGKIHQNFVNYAGGAVRHILIANARSLALIPRETPATVIRRVCEAKQDTTRHAKIAWVKFCYEHRIRDAFLTQCPAWLFDRVYRNVHHIVDYFFEVFIPAQCEQLSSYPSDILNSLRDIFVDSEFYLSDALDFAGTITPYASDVEVKGQVPAGTSDDAYLSSMQQAAQRGWS